MEDSSRVEPELRRRGGTVEWGGITSASYDCRSWDVDTQDSVSRKFLNRSRTWQAELDNSHMRFDDWGREVANFSAYQAWIFGGRRFLMNDVAHSGGWRSWLAPCSIQLEGMDRHHLLSLRWLTMPANLRKLNEPNAEKRRGIIEEIKKDLLRTCPNHPDENAVLHEVQDILTMFCAARQLVSGYTQGMNFVAALLCGFIGPLKLSRDDAFWCFSALQEYALPHLFTGGTLHGALVDFQVLQWLLEQLSPDLVAHLCKIPGYSPAFVFSRPVCTVFANCDLPGDAVLQMWKVILHSASPRIQFIRIIVALFSSAAEHILHNGEADLRSLTDALRIKFESTYDISPLLEAVLDGTKQCSDKMVLAQIEQMEKRQCCQEAVEQRRRARLAANRLCGGTAPLLGSDGLLRKLRNSWHPKPPLCQVSCEDLGKMILDAGRDIHADSFKTTPSQNFATDSVRLFQELDAKGAGSMPFIEALLLLALLLGSSERERIVALFGALDQNGNGTVSLSDFEQLSCLCDEISDVERAKQMFVSLDANGNGVLSEHEFARTLLALPSLATSLFLIDSPAHDPSPSRNDLSMNIRLRPEWAQAATLSSDSCQVCDSGFTCWRRRHHCRACGQLVCNDCSQYRLPLLVLGYASPVRTCKHCIVLLCPSTRRISSS